MTASTQLEPAVALCEMQALAEHYRNRSLALAQALSDALAESRRKDEEIALLRGALTEIQERQAA